MSKGMQDHIARVERRYRAFLVLAGVAIVFAAALVGIGVWLLTDASM